MTRRSPFRPLFPVRRVRVRKSRLIIESLEDRTVPADGQWLAVIGGVGPAANLPEQAGFGERLLHSAGVLDEDVQIVQAMDLGGTFLVQTPLEVTQEALTVELQEVPGFLFVTEYPGGPSGDAPLAGTWTQTTLAPTSIGTMMLLSDGRVMAQGGGVTKNWYQLRPDANGSYVNGTWSPLPSMGLERLYFGSNVLRDGRIFLVGGEYSGPAGSANWTNTGEIFDPVANTWSPIAPFPQTQFGDGQTEILPDGRILAGYLSTGQTYIYNPATNSWTAAADKLRGDKNNEENWALLPDSSVLSYDIWSSISLGVGHAQRYVASTNTWVDTGIVPVSLSSSALGFELGPAVLLPDGRAFQIGANSNTALYTLATNTWVAGPTTPNAKGADDAPAAILPDGHVVYAADTPLFNGPTQLFDFDPVANTTTQITSLPAQLISDLSGPAYPSRMLVLPTGQLLFTTGTSNRIWVFTPDGAPADSWRPTISSIAPNADGTFNLTGTQLNGLSEGAYYGDDAEMSTNYPIVRLTNASGNVFYARTFNWSNTGVMTGSTPVTTQFALPAGLPDGQYSLTVIANGIASTPVPFNKPFALAVISSTPAAGGTVATTPTSYIMNFSEPVDPASLQAGDLLVNGNPADGVTLTTPTSATFTFTVDPVVSQGLQTMAIAAGSITKDGDPSRGIAAFNASFRYDVTPLAVTATAPPVNGVFTLPAPLTLVVTFNEPIDAASIGTNDLTLSAGTVTAAVATAPNEATYTIGGVTNEGSLTVTLGAGKVTDTFGNPNPAAFTGSYVLDFGTVAFPTPLVSKVPLGSLVYDPTAIGTISPPGDTDSFTLNIDAGQQITVIVRPTATTLQPTVTLRDPASAILASGTAPAVNQDLILQTVTTTTAGVYTLTVGGAGTTTGSYSLQVILNAAEERERHTGQPTDNTAATAQNIDGGFLSLGGAATRGAVLGTVASSSDLDFYSFTLAAGDTATVALKGISSTAVSAQLRDATGTTVLASAITGSTNLDKFIPDFTAAASGTYYLVVSGTVTGATYDAVITKNAEFSTEANNTITQPQELLSRQVDGDQYVLGHVGASGDTVDIYKVNLGAGATLTAQTSTPAGGAGEFVNTLDPRVRVLNAAGAQVALDDNSAGDGRNALVTFTNSDAAGVFYIEVSSTTAATTAGEYVLRVNGNTVTPPAFQVTTTTPANGAVLLSAPTTITVNFNDAVLATSVQASDLTVDGLAATAVTVSAAGNSAIFTSPAGVGGAGTHTFAIAAGAIVDVQNTPLNAFSATYTVDNIAPRVTATSVAPNAVLTPGALTYQVTFSEAMKVTNLSTDDFSLHGNFRQATGVNYAASTFAFSSGGTVLTLTYTGLPDDSYTLTLLAGANGGTNFTDAAGNAQDGEFTGTFPSGNGAAGGNFAIGFAMDPGTEAYPTPLTAEAPLGSLIYDPTLTRAIAFAGDTDSFTLAVDPGQTISVSVTPAAAALRPAVEIRDPSGNLLGAATAPAAGQAAFLSALTVASGGTYTLTVSGAGGTTGLYTAPVTLNAALEAENNGGGPNDTRASAQSLDSSMLSLQAGSVTAFRGAVIGGNGFTANFETGQQGFTVNNSIRPGTGLWHLSSVGNRANQAGHSAVTSFYYGQNESPGPGNYNTGVANAGTITSSAIALPAAGPITLSFNYILQTEGNGSFDVASVQVSNNGGATFTTVASSTSAAQLPLSSTWRAASFSLSAFAGQTVLLRFSFDTIDSIANNFEGWYVDDVQLSSPVTWNDYYSITVGANETVSAALKYLTGSGASVSIEDGTGAVLATGVAGATNYDRGISNLVFATAGTYYARVSGSAAATYSLVVTRNAAFDTEGNGTFDTAQSFGTQGALGANVTASTPTVVLPNANGTTEGDFENSFPFNIGAFSIPSMRYQQIYAHAQFTGAGVIDKLRFRKDGTFGANFSTSNIDVKINLSYAATTATTPSNVFANNIGAGAVTVFDGLLSLSSTGTGTPNPFEIVVDVADLFNYDPSQGDLLVDVFMRNAPVTTAFDAVGTSQTATSRIYSNNSVNDTSGSVFQSGLVTRFDFVSGGEADWYSVNVASTANTLRLATVTPADGPNQFVNTLNPHIDLFDPSGNLVASGAALGDGRNEFLEYQPLVTGTYRVRVIGESGTTGEYFVSKNFSPAVTTAVTSPVNENDTATLTGTINDPDVLDSHTVVITWGPDEGSTTLTLAAGVSTFSATHQYLDDNPTGTAADNYPIGVAVTDNHGASGSASTAVTVNNVAPTDVVLNSGTIDENGTFSLSGSFADVGTLDSHTVVINWGTGEGTTTIDLPAGVLSFTASHQYLDDNPNGTSSDVVPVSVTVTDDDTGVGTGATSVTVNNVAPTDVTLNSGTIDESGTFNLSGSFADVGTLDTHTVVINWGSGEGSTTLSLAAGVSTFSASHQYLDDNPSGTPSDTFPVNVTVTDDDGGTGTGATTVTVNNVAPVVGPVVGPSPAPAVRGQTVAFAGSFTDVGTLDTHQVSWDFGDGTVIPFHPSTDAGALTPTHVFTEAGLYTLTLTVRDDDTGTNSSSKSVTVQVVALQDDPLIPGAIDLAVGGGNATDDVIRFTPVSNGGTIRVTLNDMVLGDYQPTGRLLAFGQGGNDDIQVASTIDMAAWLYGDAGNDRLKGARGATLLMGGAGNDDLKSGGGRTVMIGGAGADLVSGGTGDDLVIGGSTQFDADAVALFGIVSEWAGPRDYATRVANLRRTGSGPRLNDNYFLTAATVLDDGVVDTLTGGSGLDWFWALGSDIITDLGSGETSG